ncbi:MAG: FKBP-type peptidyl-prolyl cis-trans isomerase [Treponema sp.]|jgi:FKBP-type peptidyl-prolyl cis-trans isomerase|nr:FKBP-type peptidyl-prolyl cis-trans isomerase [Treponema sp.]
MAREIKMVKKIALTALILFNAWFVCGAQDAAGGSSDADTSYAFGVALGSDFKQAGLSFNYDALLQGFKDSMEGRETRITLGDAIPLIQIAMREAMAKQAEENRQRGLSFLAENARKPGVFSTPSGLQYEVISQGTGPKPGESDRVSVHYEGTLLDGDIFDSSYARNEPAEFALDEVIPGWTEGIQLMNVGGSYRFVIPPGLAYGEQGYGNVIPANSTLIFKVELLGIVE